MAKLSIFFIFSVLMSAVFFASVSEGQSTTPVSAPKSSPRISAPSPKKAPPTPATLSSPPIAAEAPASSPSSISMTPANAPAPAVNGAGLNRFAIACSVAVGLCASVLLM